MEPNAYDSPHAPLSETSCKSIGVDERYKEVIRRGRDSNRRLLRIFIYSLFVGDVCVVTAATSCFVFAAEWNPETGEPYAVLGLLGGVVALRITVCAVLTTFRFLSSLNWFDRFCAFGTVVAFLTGLAIAFLDGRGPHL